MLVQDWAGRCDWMLVMSILDDLKAAQTHDINCDCNACLRALRLVGEVRGVLCSDSPASKVREGEPRWSGTPFRRKVRGS